MTWTAWYVLLPAACVVSLLVHEVNQWAERTVNRHVTAALDESTFAHLCQDYTDALERKIADLDLADWEAELDRPYNWQDDGL